MTVRPRSIVLAVFLAVAASCAPFAKQAGLGPWAGRPTPTVEGVDSAGQPVRLAELKGKVVLLSFWAGF